MVVSTAERHTPLHALTLVDVSSQPSTFTDTVTLSIPHLFSLQVMIALRSFSFVFASISVSFVSALRSVSFVFALRSVSFVSVAISEEPQTAAAASDTNSR